MIEDVFYLLGSAFFLLAMVYIIVAAPVVRRLK
jgi:hypothetical protein